MIPSPAEVLMAVLRSAGVVAKPGHGAWASTVGPLPAQGSPWVSFLNRGADLTPMVDSTGRRVVFPRVQILIRSDDTPEGWDRGVQIQDYCSRIGASSGTGLGWISITVGGGNCILKAARVITELSPLGEEPDTQKQLHVVNVRLTYTYSPFVAGTTSSTTTTTATTAFGPATTSSTTTTTTTTGGMEEASMDFSNPTNSMYELDL